jgi:hypothetical protein
MEPETITPKRWMKITRRSRALRLVCDTAAVRGFTTLLACAEALWPVESRHGITSGH